MKFYIASKLGNREQVARLAAALKAAGHTHTYDWTAHAVKDTGEGVIRAVAAAESQGVLEADFLVVVLPGGRGTHVELGLALGAGGKKIILCSPDDGPFKSDGETCAFYWCPGVVRAAGTPEDWLAAILAEAAQWDNARAGRPV